MGITKRSFGKSKEGQEVFLYEITNKNQVTLTVSDFGAAWVHMLVPDREGNRRDVVLGYDSAEGYYVNPGHFGAVVGRNGNRIGNARFEINGTEYQLPVNDNKNNLHSGPDWYRTRVWDVKEIDEEKNSVTFGLFSPDGDQGFPGNFSVTVTYELTEENEVVLHYQGSADADTIVNMTNHSYFNLNGHASGDVLEQEMWVDADAFTATDSLLIPTGEILSVTDTPMDFRVRKKIGRDIDADFEAIGFGGGYDHNWCLNNQGKFAKVAEMWSQESGITMEVYTDLPGVQIYAGNFLDQEVGKNGVVYRKRQGICFETQHYPDAINHENFPSPILRAGEIYQTRTVYRFV